MKRLRSLRELTGLTSIDTAGHPSEAPMSTSTAPTDLFAKARDLSGRDGLLFRRNSVSGALEALARTGTWGELNAALHAN